MIKKIGRFLTVSSLLFWLIGSTIWAALAVIYGDSSSSTIQSIITSTVALVGFASVLSLLFLPRWRKKLLLIHSFVFLTVMICWLNISADNDRQWQADVSKLAHASINGDFVTIHNIRNFTYRREFDYIPGYYDKTVNLNNLEGLDLFAVYWMGPSIAHVIMSFDFGSGNHIAVSIEARKEVGEGYSTLKGFFRQYELIYIVADERDLIGLRTHYRNNPPEQVYRYRLKPAKENTKRLFLEYLDSINSLYEKPDFYNTLLANCTSLIWLHSRVNPGHLPFSWKILLSGYVPEYLYETGRLKEQGSFDTVRSQAFVNPLVEKQEISEEYVTAIRP